MQVVSDRPADATAGEHLDHRGEVNPAFTGSMRGMSVAQSLSGTSALNTRFTLPSNTASRRPSHRGAICGSGLPAARPGASTARLGYDRFAGAGPGPVRHGPGEPHRFPARKHAVCESDRSDARRRDPAPTDHGNATRNTTMSISSAPGRPPRRESRSRARGPSGTLFWEHILPRKIGGRAFQYLDLYRLNAVLSAQVNRFGVLISGEANRLAVFDVRLGHQPT